MDAHEYTESIKIDTQEEYREYQDMLYKQVKDGLTNQKDTIELTWKGKSITIDLNHSSFLIGYNYGVTTTLKDFKKEGSEYVKSLEKK